MNNEKTGLLIRERRKAQGLTQRELAGRLHVTEQAVSKWERGLCAPDIALLGPLADILQISVVELLEGEMKAAGHWEREEAHARTLLSYSGQEIRRRMLRTRRAIFSVFLLCLLGLLAGGLLLCRSGRPFVIDRVPAPDGTRVATVYSKELGSRGFTLRDATSLIVSNTPDEGEARVTYGNCTYQGLWWAPDGKKYVLALDYGDETYLALAWLERHSESNLNAYLSMGVEATELKKYGSAKDTGWPEIRYQFLQWSADSNAMLLYYSFEAANGLPHEGYFWYFCETGEVRAILELEA